MTTICGHERTLVAEALQMMDGVSDGLLRVIVAGVRAKNNSGPKADAVEALLDPAKLAAMMEAEGQRLRVALRVIVCNPPEFGDLSWGVRGAEYGGFWRMEHARTRFAKLLQLPNGAREEAERVLRGDA